MKHFTPYWCLPVLFFVQIGFSQEWQISSLTTNEGLSQGQINYLYKDSRGYIWIGTKQGLNRFDGIGVKNYVAAPFSTWGLPSDEIEYIHEDEEGLLWIATDKGLVVFEPFSERFFLLHQAGSLALGPVLNVVALPGGKIVVLQRIEGETKIFRIQAPQNLTQKIRTGSLNANMFEFAEMKHNRGESLRFAQLFLLPDNSVLTFDHKRKLCVIDLQRQIVRPITVSELPLDYEGNYSLLYGKDKNKGWIFPKPASDTTILSMNNYSIFNIISDGRKVINRHIQTNAIYHLDIKPEHQCPPDLMSDKFYSQFTEIARLDKAINGEAIFDDNGNLWYGTTGYGVRILRFSPHKIRHLGKNTSFYNMSYLPDNRIWPGLFFQKQFLDISSNTFIRGSWNDIMPEATELYELHRSPDGNLWAVGAYSNNNYMLIKYEASSGSCIQIPLPSDLYFFKDIPLRILEDQKGFIWLAGNNGQLIRIHPQTLQLKRWKLTDFFTGSKPMSLRSYFIVELAGEIWIGTSGGLVTIREYIGNTPDFLVIHQADSPIPGMASFEVLSVCADPFNADIFWLGTKGGGLSRLDRKKLQAKTFTTKDGLTNNVVYGILPDDFGRLWMSTNRGISLFNPRQERFSALYREHSNLNTEFNTGAYLRLSSGELAFGSVDGLFLIQPGEEASMKIAPKVLVQQIEVNGINLDFADFNIVQIDSDNSILLNLPHQKNNVAISFAALPFNFPSSFQYRYRLIGDNKAWIPIGKKGQIMLAALPPGIKSLELQAASFNSDWSDSITTIVHISIAPPWYNSPIAWVLYLLAIIGISWYFLDVQKNRMELQYSIDLSKKEAARLKSMDEFKNKILAYISHEFKTPLTIIRGLTDRIRHDLPASDFPALKGGIVRQTDNMLELVNQIMDIGKSGDQALSLSMGKGNIAHYLQYLTESFRPLAEMRGISLNFYASTPKLIMDFDPERIKYVVHNLLNNALRHTPSNGQIEVLVDSFSGDRLLFQVKDTGEGIAEGDIPKLFERYFVGSSTAIKEGRFGLGLPFVKDIVELHGGIIEVDSKKGKGTTFSITIPITQNAASLDFDYAQTGRHQSISVNSQNEEEDSDKPLVLVVEDNPVISEWIGSILNASFRLIFACNGKEGFELAVQQIPDIVLTDLVMPVEDGLMLTSKLKAHELTNHIPVLLISAQSELEKRIESRRAGANAFLAKPFYPQELLLAMLNLQAHQERLRQRYSPATKESLAGSSGFTASNPNPYVNEVPFDPFMAQLFQVFEENYSNEKFSREDLCRALLISKSQLQRKVAATSSLTPMELLRNFRLEKARLLLESNADLQIREISVLVGFADPAHFSKVFSKTYGASAITLKKAQKGNSSTEA